MDGAAVENSTNFISITMGDLITLIGICIAIWQFRKQMIETRNTTTKNNKLNWFLNVIVLPQLNPINDFYKELITIIIADKSLLNEKRDECDETDFMVELAAVKQSRKTKINDFYDHFVSLIKSYNTEMARNVSAEIMELEDIVTALLDDSNSLNEEKIRRDILQNKQRIIGLLNQGMR